MNIAIPEYLTYSLLSIILLGLLTNCASLAQVHQSCYQQTATFAAQVDCINQQISQEESLASSTYVQEYQQTAAVLEERLAAGDITEKEARLRLTEKLNNIEMRELRTRALMNEAYERPYPLFTDCRKIDGHISCRSY